MPTPELVLAVDGGGTKTEAVIATREGTILTAARTQGSCLRRSRNLPVALDAITRASADALHAAERSWRDVSASCFCLAGLDFADERPRIHRQLSEAMPELTHVVVYNDVRATLRAGNPHQRGAALVCGTGTNAAARAPQGGVFTGGFWLATPSGAALLAAQVLAAVSDAYLGHGPRTSLTGRALDALGVDSVPDLLQVAHPLDRHSSLPDLTGLLAPLVVEEATAGDPVAAGLLSALAVSLARAVELVRTVARSGHGDAVQVSGGMFRSPGVLLDLLRAVQPGRVIRVVPEPIRGAIELAWDAADGVPYIPEWVPPQTDVRNDVAVSGPPR